jgi:hypothetical protein
MASKAPTEKTTLTKEFNKRTMKDRFIDQEGLCLHAGTKDKTNQYGARKNRIVMTEYKMKTALNGWCLNSNMVMSRTLEFEDYSNVN